MKIKQKNLLVAILAAALAPSISAAQGMELDRGFTLTIPSLENTLIDSKIAASAGDLGAMRDIAMQPFEGSIARNADSTPVVLDSVREETKKAISLNAVPGSVGEATTKDTPSTAKAGRPSLSSKVPAMAQDRKGDDGNIANIYVAKGLKYLAIATAATLLVGGAVAGALLLGVPGAAIGLVVGAAVIGVLASKALKAFWNTF
ncbi:MAG: hypothetical protein KKH28_10300 [Elusimicrobia bacterium]|nr:hypothetical protein [Elusimicrobiota bacterium]